MPRLLTLTFAHLLLLLVTLGTPSPSAPPTTPTPMPPLSVTGMVKMGTANTMLPLNLPVTLHVLRVSSSGTTLEPVTQSLPLAADGQLHFQPFDAKVGDVCVLTIDYQGITQGSAPYSIQGTESTLTLPVTLYNKTTDPASVKITRTNQTLHFAPGNLLAVLETVDWTTTGDRFYLSEAKTETGDPISVQLTLPVGARAVAFSTQPVRRFAIGGDANSPVIEDTVPVIPGIAHHIVFSYQVPYTQGAYIDRDYSYTTDQLTINVPNDASVAVSGINGATFSAKPNTTLDAQRPYTEYTLTTPLNAGGRLIYTLSGAPQVVVDPGQVPSANTGLSVGTTVVLIGTVLIVGLITLWLIRTALLRRRQ